MINGNISRWVLWISIPLTVCGCQSLPEFTGTGPVTLTPTQAVAYSRWSNLHTPAAFFLRSNGTAFYTYCHSIGQCEGNEHEAWKKCGSDCLLYGLHGEVVWKFDAPADPNRKFKPVDSANNSYAQGWIAYTRGDYATALSVWRQLAEQGHGLALNKVGDMYYEGQGVPRDDAEAFRWYMKAADLGHASFYQLGRMYQFGEGVERDNVQAHKWYSLWARNGSSLSAGYRDTVAKKMTFAQIAEAQRLAGEWRAKHRKGK